MENTTAFFIPGLLIASFKDLLYWFGLFISVISGFIAAYPINYFMISRGFKESHVH
jgi:hypothetical protein